MASPAPLVRHPDGLATRLRKALGKSCLDIVEAHGEICLRVARDSVADVLKQLRDDFAYQQCMEIAGVDYPARAERFEVVYCLLSVTLNHRLRVAVTTDEATPVPSVTGVYPSAGWLEREVYDMYGVVFSGHPDLRRILTDYGFVGHPQRKDFPLTGYVELRYSEAEKRVVYEPVSLAQDFRSFDFMSPWEGARYVLPGDEKAAPTAASPAPAAASPAKVDGPKKVTRRKAGGQPTGDAAAAPKPKAARKPRKPKGEGA